MPAMGTTNAALTTRCLRSSLPRLRLGLLIGVCGGIPRSEDPMFCWVIVVVSNTVVKYS